MKKEIVSLILNWYYAHWLKMLVEQINLLMLSGKILMDINEIEQLGK